MCTLKSLRLNNMPTKKNGKRTHYRKLRSQFPDKNTRNSNDDKKGVEETEREYLNKDYNYKRQHSKCSRGENPQMLKKNPQKFKLLRNLLQSYFQKNLHFHYIILKNNYRFSLSFFFKATNYFCKVLRDEEKK